MKKHIKLLLFFLLTLALVVLVALLAQSNAPQTKIEKALLFPELVDQINEITRIEIDNANDVAVVLQKDQEQWVLESADNYPAELSRIKAAVIGLSQLTIAAEKTDNPERYAGLGVNDPVAGGDSAARLLTLSNAAGQTLLELIVGNLGRSSLGRGGKPSLYVRKPDAEHALLVEGYLQLSAYNDGWYDRNVINIPDTRIKGIDLKKDGTLLQLGKSAVGDAEFEVMQGDTETPAASFSRLGTFLADLRAEGVQSAEAFEFPDDESIIVTFMTFNGLVVTVTSVVKEEKIFARFSFTALKQEESGEQETEVEEGAEPSVVEVTEPAAVEGAEPSVVEVTEPAAVEGAELSVVEVTDPTAVEGTEPSVVEVTDPAIVDGGVDDAETEAQGLQETLNPWVYQIPDFKFDSLNIEITGSEQ